MTELPLAEFFKHGPHRDCRKPGKSLLRKSKDGKFMEWNVEADDALCTQQEAFQLVWPGLGFNIQVNFDDYIVYEEPHCSSPELHLTGTAKIVFSSLIQKHGQKFLFS